MIGAWRNRATARRWFIALAALALMVQVLIPQGYMVSADPAARGLVICTGHGPLLSLDDHGHPAKAPGKSGADSVCGFAAHAAGAPPPSLAALIPVAFEPQAVAAAPRLDLVPGRGLAAPPPPSHAPPSRVI